MEEIVTPEQSAANEDKLNAFWAATDEKAATIGANLKCKVFSIVLQDTEGGEDFVVGFAKVPDLTTQLRLIDKSADNSRGVSLEACSTALDSLIITSESDTRITDKENTAYWKGACLSMSYYMGFAIPVLKKK